jgi:O-antigen/teichoic acid export membrane protein
MGNTKEKSRVTYTIYNFTSSIGGQLITIIMNFVVRTAFIYTLGKSYLGINGLFSNILSMLGLTELGIGSAILFKLYDPIASGDKKRIALLMKFYKTAYRVIGVVVALLGVILVPFLPVIIKDYDTLGALNINATLIFLLFVFRSVSSYLFFSFKSAIIKADQKTYIINLVSYVFSIAAGILRIIFLFAIPNFFIYILISILQTIGQNIVCAIIADHMYPYINEKSDDKISSDEVKGIMKDCEALFIYRANSFVLKATDNIVLSAFVGVGIVALYSNYYIFYTTINTLLSKIYDSLTHSLGNLHTERRLGHEYEVFKAIGLITAIVGGTIAVGITCVADEFVKTWIGKEWIIAQPFSLLLGIELYTLAINKFLNRFRTIMGLFQQAKYRPIATMVINLGVSALLVNFIGVYGVLIGTITANWLTMLWYDPVIIHKYGFGEGYPVSAYFAQLAQYVVILTAVGTADYLICRYVLAGYGWFSVGFHAIICGISVPLVLLLTQAGKEEGQYVLKLINRFLTKVTKKMKRK